MQTEATDSWAAEHRAHLESDAPLRLSLVELVVRASELTEDEGELRDLVDGLVGAGRVELEGLV